MAYDEMYVNRLIDLIVELEENAKRQEAAHDEIVRDLEGEVERLRAQLRLPQK